MHLSYSLALLTLFLSFTSALKFELIAHPQGIPRCIRNYVGADTLVVVTARVSGQKGDGQRVNIDIRDTEGNEYGRPRDVAGEARMAFTSHGESTIEVCFENILRDGMGPGLFRTVELDVDIGSDAYDYAAIQKAEKLKPIEVELRRIENVVNEIVQDMEYLKGREQTMRNTNESTNDRVKYFAIVTSMVLMGLTGWQIAYLRTYFKRKGMLE